MSAYRSGLASKIDALVTQRKELRNDMRRLKRGGDTIAAEAVKGQISDISKKLRELRKEVGLYLGGNEQSTHEYVSKLLGKETIDMNTYGQSRGRNGSYSTNWQLAGRELLTPDEVRMLDNQYALLFIRGERPVQDFKYDILKHPNVSLTTDGGAEPFVHGEDTRSIAAISIDPQLLKEAVEIDVETHRYEILTGEELEEKIKDLEEKRNEKQ